MDYSLLIGIHDVRQAAEDAEARDGNRSDPHHDSESENEYDSGERLVLFGILKYIFGFLGRKSDRFLIDR